MQSQTMIDGIESEMGGGYQTTFNPDETEPSVAVSLAVAEVEGIAPNELDTMSPGVDSESLDRFLGSDVLAVTFEYHGYTVLVEKSGQITLRPDG